MPSGILIWITIAMIARSPTPERWAGIYLTIQTLAQFVLAAALAAWVISRSGANGGFVALAVLCVISAVAALALPNRFAPLVADNAVQQHAERSRLRRTGGAVPVDGVHRRRVGLRGAVVTPGRSRADCRRRRGFRIARVPGARRRDGDAARRASALVSRHSCSARSLNVGCLLAFAALPSESLYLLTSGVFGFLWLFSLPFMVPMVIAADPTRRAAVLVGGAELTGGSLGPLFASFVVSDVDVRGSLGFGAVALAVTVAIAFALHRRERTVPATIVET